MHPRTGTSSPTGLSCPQPHSSCSECSVAPSVLAGLPSLPLGRLAPLHRARCPLASATRWAELSGAGRACLPWGPPWLSALPRGQATARSSHCWSRVVGAPSCAVCLVTRSHLGPWDPALPRGQLDLCWRPTLQQDVAAFLLYSTAPHGIRDTGSPCISAEAPQLRQGGTCFLPVMHPLCLTPLLGRGGETVTTRTVTKRPSSRARAPGLRHY